MASLTAAWHASDPGAAQELFLDDLLQIARESPASPLNGVAHIRDGETCTHLAGATFLIPAYETMPFPEVRLRSMVSGLLTIMAEKNPKALVEITIEWEEDAHSFVAVYTTREGDRTWTTYRDMTRSEATKKLVRKLGKQVAGDAVLLLVTSPLG